jgi:hypothetical protein
MRETTSVMKVVPRLAVSAVIVGLLTQVGCARIADDAGTLTPRP